MPLFNTYIVGWVNVVLTFFKPNALYKSSIDPQEARANSILSCFLDLKQKNNPLKIFFWAQNQSLLTKESFFCSNHFYFYNSKKKVFFAQLCLTLSLCSNSFHIQLPTWDCVILLPFVLKKETFWKQYFIHKFLFYTHQKNLLDKHGLSLNTK